jgi:hypothetical protein
MKYGWKKITVIGSFIVIYSIGMYFGIMTLFPDNLLHTRTVLFAPSGNGGYYLIDDAINSNLPQPSDIYFYGYGNLTIEKHSVLWSQDGFGLNLTVLTENVDIFPISGKVYLYEQNSTTAGVRFRTKDLGTTRVISLLYPFLLSTNTTLPLNSASNLSAQGFQGRVINTSDFFYWPENANCEKPFHIGEISGKANRIWMRTLENGNITSFYAYGTELRQSTIFSKQYDTLKPILLSYDADIPELTPIFNTNTVPTTHRTQSTPIPLPLNPTQIHPVLYCNSSQLQSLESRINGTIEGPWARWYAMIHPDWSTLLDRAFRIWYLNATNPVLLSEEEITSTINALLDIRSLEPFTQNLHRGDRTNEFILAYDFLYNFMLPSQRTQFETDAFAITYPAADAWISRTMPDNNHQLVSLSGYGLLGLVTGNRTMVQFVQDRIDHYFSDFIRAEGACFEEMSYADYTFEHTTRFMYALQKMGGYNYFRDENFLHFLNYTTYTRMPDGSHALFEDSHPEVDLSPILLRALTQVHAVDGNLASRMRWYVDQKGLENVNSWAIVHHLLMLDQNILPEPVYPDTPWNGSYYFFDSGQAGLGTGQQSNDTMLVLSNKAYTQMHGHYDENSVEFWAYGVKILTNAGYPGFGAPGHSHAVSTKANNAVIISGHEQARLESDGFRDAVFSKSLQAITSPNSRSYIHPLGWSVFPWWSLLLVISCLFSAIIISPKYSENHADPPINSPDAKKTLKYSLFISLTLLMSSGFLLTLVRLLPYIQKIVQHMEANPQTRSLFLKIVPIAFWTSIVLGLIGSVIQIAVTFRSLQKYRISYSRIVTYLGVYSLVVLLVWQTIGYLSLLWGLEQLITQGSTILRLLEYIIHVLIYFWYFIILLMGVRIMLALLIIKEPRFIRKILIHGLFGIVLFIGLTITLGTLIPIIPVEAGNFK